MHEKALSISKKPSDANPSVTEFQGQLAKSYNNVGLNLSLVDRSDDAMKAYEKALEIKENLARQHPESPEFASLVGVTLNNMAVLGANSRRFTEAQKRYLQALNWHSKSLAPNSKNPQYRRLPENSLSNLVVTSRELGDFETVAQAELELGTLRDLDPTRMALDIRLDATITGDQEPKDDTERLQLAQREYDKSLYASAAKLWTEALSTEPSLADDRQSQTRYNAACAAASAGFGQGKDSPIPDDAAKAKLREQALGWLQTDLVSWRKFLDSGPATVRPFIVQTPTHWKKDTHLAGIRDEASLAKLPEAEREAFRKLWADVEALRKRAAGE